MLIEIGTTLINRYPQGIALLAGNLLLLNTDQPVMGIVMVIQNRLQEIGKILINL